MAENLSVNALIEGKVVRIKPFGAIIALDGGRQGLVHISHVSDKFVQDICDYVNVGDVVKVKVLSMDETGEKIALSMKEAGPHEPAPRPPRVSFFDEPDSRQPKDLTTFEDKFKDWVRSANERQATISKRKKRK